MIRVNSLNGFRDYQILLIAERAVGAWSNAPEVMFSRRQFKLRRFPLASLLDVMVFIGG
jgi:hypothetical protein